MKLIKLIILTISLCLLPIASLAATLPFTSIVIFGDSLSDNGNLYSLYGGFLPKSPPYYNGRFSNGPVWADNFADALKHNNQIDTVNYAMGGETVNFYGLHSNILSYDLSISVFDYYAHNVLNDKSKTLYIMWIGANDYMRAPIKDLDKLSDDVINTMKNTIIDLITHGAKYFLIVNLPDMGKTPMAKAQNEVESLSKATAVHNGKLLAVVTQLQLAHKSVKLNLFDINKVFADLLAHPDFYNSKYNLHISDATSSCWLGGYTAQLSGKVVGDTFARDSRLQSKVFVKRKQVSEGDVRDAIMGSIDLLTAFAAGQQAQDGVKPCDDPGALVFWDSVHPSDAVHLIISNIAVDYVSQNYSK